MKELSIQKNGETQTLRYEGGRYYLTFKEPNRKELVLEVSKLRAQGFIRRYGGYR